MHGPPAAPRPGVPKMVAAFAGALPTTIGVGGKSMHIPTHGIATVCRRRSRRAPVALPEPPLPVPGSLLDAGTAERQCERTQSSKSFKPRAIHGFSLHCRFQASWCKKNWDVNKLAARPDGNGNAPREESDGDYLMKYMSSIQKSYISFLSCDWIWMDVTLAGFQGNTAPQPSCAKAASENFTVICFQLPLVGRLNL